MADATVKLEASQPAAESAPVDSTTAETSASNDVSVKLEATNAEDAQTEDQKDVSVKLEATEDTEATKPTEPTEATKTDEATKAGEKDESTKNENRETTAHRNNHRYPHKHHRDSRNNIKSDPSILPDTDDPVQIRSQVQTRSILTIPACSR